MQQEVKTTEAGIVNPMAPALYRVERYIKETYDTFTIELAQGHANGGHEMAKTFNYGPGQFNMLYVFGMGEAPISISGNTSGSGLLTHTIRAVGAITKAMQTLRLGDAVGVRGPFGTEWPVGEAKGKDVVLVAGGIGLAPLRPVILAVLANRSAFGKVSILYGARTPEDMIFKHEVKKWKSGPELEIFDTVDKATTAWRGSVGVVTKLIPQLQFNPSNTIAMICGPEIMMHFTIEALRQRGLTNRDIYVSMERNMKCAVGFCGHCQYGPHFICRDGAVFPFDRLEPLFRKHEI